MPDVRRVNVIAVAGQARPFEIDDLEAIEQARREEYTLPVLLEAGATWQMPVGAFASEGCGRTEAPILPGQPAGPHETHPGATGGAAYRQSSKELDMAKQSKVEGRDLIDVRGERYEWNDTFQGYWSVQGDPRELQAELIANMPLEIRIDGEWMISGSECSILVIFNNLSGANSANPEPGRSADHTNANYLRSMEHEWGVKFSPGRVLTLHQVLSGEEQARHVV